MAADASDAVTARLIMSNGHDRGMRAFVVRAVDDGWPVPGVFDSLESGRATIGWSSLDRQDLRTIERTLKEGGALDADQSAARRCLGFLQKPTCGDYLLYPHQPERGQFTIVTVAGEYDFAPVGDDFRSFRPCEPVGRNAFSVYDPVVPSKLRSDLGRQGRFYEIHNIVALASFLRDMEFAGGTDSSNSPALARIHADLRRHIPDALAREFSRHDLSRKFCAELFERMGHAAEIQEGSHEAGSDVVVTLGNPLLPDDVQFRIGIQVFAFEGQVERHALIRKLAQLVDGWKANDLTYGVLLTTGRCSADARDALRDHNRQNQEMLVRLVDADDLADLFLRYFPPEGV